MINPKSHPAPFSPEILEVFQTIVDEWYFSLPSYAWAPNVLDPFAGVGNIHKLQRCNTLGIELEPEWANQHPQTEVGDATALIFEGETLDSFMRMPGGRPIGFFDQEDFCC
jgi:hypothetical protein